MWNADGAPFMRLQFRPAAYASPPAVAEGAAALGDAEGAGGGQEAKAQLVPPPSLPKPLLKELALALRRRDPVAFSRAMDKLEDVDPKHQDYDERVRLFMNGLQNILLDPSLMAGGGADFVLEAIEEKLRAPSAGAPYEGSGAPSGTVGRRPKMFRSKHDMAPASCMVLQPPSVLDDWEGKSTMGLHPGVLFGAHAGATFAHFPADEVYGGYAQGSEHIQDFARRYPNAALATFSGADSDSD